MVTYYLQKTLSAAGNSCGFSGANIQISLDSAVTNVTRNIDKKYGAKVYRPYSRGSYENYAPKTILVDTKQIEDIYTITGVLSNDSGNISNLSPATVNTAVNKMNVLTAMAQQGGTLTFAHRNIATTETVNVIKMEFKDIETDVGSDETSIMREGEVRLHFTIVLQRGQDR